MSVHLPDNKDFTKFVPATKCCSTCQDALPLDAIHFDRDNHAPDGFRDDCKQCRSERRKKQHDEEIDQRLEQLDTAAMNMIGHAVTKNYSKLPHIGEVFECLMRVFGGPQGYAEHYLGTYLTAKPGSQQRVKLLTLIAQIGNQTTQSGAAKVPKEYLSDEDLQREIEETGRRLLLLKAPPEDKEVA